MKSSNRIKSVIAIFADGTKKYFDTRGKLHRSNGAAIEYSDGSKSYYRHGYLHREDGPAVVRSSGKSRYYLFNKAVNRYDVKIRLANKLSA